jgi:ATP-dependent RNA helicase RhlE
MVDPPAPGPLPEEPVGPFPEGFAALGLSARLLGGVRDAGYGEPTNIQAQSIPLALSGKDIIGASQTGTGKTAAFGLPMMQRLGAPTNRPRALILGPTRELTLQAVESLGRLGLHTGLKCLAIYGGVDMNKQIKAVQAGVDIIIATPGRLLDLRKQGVISLKGIEILILDEVDRMLDMGFLPDVRRIVEACPVERQTLLFSATMPMQIKGLAQWALREPTEVEIGIRYSAAETVSHYFYPVAMAQREALLMAILEKTEFKSVMIFTRTKMDADRLHAAIKLRGYDAGVMHGDIPQKQRESALTKFRDGTTSIIVATDVAARGLDVSGVTHVINYAVPENAEDYVHRIGRTGRAQQEGDAYTLLSADELPYAESIERMIDQKIERRRLDGFDYEYTSLLDQGPTGAAQFSQMFRNRPPAGGRRKRR